MKDLSRELQVFTDGDLFEPGAHFHLFGKISADLYPSLFTLECMKLKDSAVTRLMNSKTIKIQHAGSCVAYGKISDVFRQTTPEGTVTTVAFSPNMDLWEPLVSLSVEAGVSVSETVRRILEASGTGIQLLSFPGEDKIITRAQAFCNRTAECISEALSAVSSKAYLVPAGLCIIPKDPLTATLHLTAKDLTDIPMLADRGNKLILSTIMAGFQPGEEMTLTANGNTYAGIILERMVDADSVSGPWKTQLLIELHR